MQADGTLVSFLCLFLPFPTPPRKSLSSRLGVFVSPVLQSLLQVSDCKQGPDANVHVPFWCLSPHPLLSFLYTSYN